MSETIVITGKENIQMFHLLQLKYALKLELVGLKHSQGSVYAYVKRQFGFKGNKQKVFDQLCQHIETKHTEMAQ